MSAFPLSLLRSPRDGSPIIEWSDHAVVSTSGDRFALSEEGIPLFAADAMSDDARVQEAHYDRVADAYVANMAYPHTQVYSDFLERCVDDGLGDGDLGVFAEICCGHGDALTRYAGRYTHGVGVDVSTRMLAAAHPRFDPRNVTLLQGDATNLPLADAVFDNVVMLGGIHHVNDRQALFSEVARILRPGGRFVFREPVSDTWLWRGLRSVIYRLSPALDADTERPLLWSETVPVLRDSGFDVVDWRTEGFVGFMLLMNSDVLVFNRAFRFVPGIRAITRGFVGLDRVVGSLPGLSKAGLQVVGTAVRR